MTSVIQPILEKGIVDHSILHRVLIEYLSVAEEVCLRYYMHFIVLKTIVLEVNLCLSYMLLLVILSSLLNMKVFFFFCKFSATDVIKQLSSPLLVRMIHTRDGSRVGMLCVKHGSAKVY